MQTLHAAVI